MWASSSVADWWPAALLLFDALARSVIVLALAWAVAWLMRGASAARRHQLWLGALIAIALLPIATSALPAWRVSLFADQQARTLPIRIVTSAPTEPPVADAAPARMPEPAESGAARSVSSSGAPQRAAAPAPTEATTGGLSLWYIGAWALGALAAAMPLVLSHLRLRNVRRGARPVDDPTWLDALHAAQQDMGVDENVPLLVSGDVNVPLTFGLTRKRATVLLPDDALDWDEPRRRLVLRHEMAHIVRRDCAKQLLARLIVALYWINPLAWLALRKLHNEQERASDDMVLARGAKASDYAMQLLQIASAPSRLPAAAAVPMARRGYLETRVQAILDPKCDRRPANRRSSVMIFVMLAVVAGALAIVRPVAEAASIPPRTVHLPEDAVFGNVVNMRIDGDRMGWVDFDNERIIGDAPSPPPPSEPDAMRQWLRDGGIDATCEVMIYGMHGYDLDAIPLPRQAWDQLSPRGVAELVQRAQRITPTRQGSLSVVAMRGELPLPATFAIHTREGGFGVLQITAASGDPKNAFVALRYRMVRSGSPSRAPRRFYTRRPDYNPRDNPTPIKPTTLGNAMPPPQEAIVLGRPIRWWASHWSGQGMYTHAVADITRDDAVRFVVNEPDRRKVWVKYFDVPIDWRAYPIVVMTYRAHRLDIDDNDEYALYFDDGSGPDYGGLIPFTHHALQVDGRRHVLTYDLRTMQPYDDLIGMAVGVRSEGDAHMEAWFELIDLRFEAVAPLPPPRRDQRVHVLVRDPSGEPLGGAKITVDAERTNWARSTVTDNDGRAAIDAYHTADGRHMLRIEHDDYLTMEHREAGSSDASTPIAVTMRPAARYRGIVTDGAGEPVEAATVAVIVPGRPAGSAWVRQDAYVLTDARGRFETPPLPGDVDAVSVRVAHPDYSRGSQVAMDQSVDVALLRNGDHALVIEPQVADITGRVVDESGRPIADARVRSNETSVTTRTNADGRFTLTRGSEADRIGVEHDDYAPAYATVDAQDSDVQLQMESGAVLRVRIVDEHGQPVEGARMGIRNWAGGWRPAWQGQSDSDGMIIWPHAPRGTHTFGVFHRERGVWVHPQLAPDSTTHTVILQGGNSDPPANDDARDPRREGYDPFRIFRGIS